MIQPHFQQPCAAPASGRRRLLAASLVALAAALPGADLGEVEVHGFISQGYVRTNANGYYDPSTCDGGSIEFREIGLNVVARPEERLRLGIQVMSQDMGRLYNNALAIDWANAVYTQPLADWELDLKVGRIRTGHALYNDYRDLDLSRTSVFLPESVYYNSWRRLYLALDGVGMELRSPATRFGSFRLGAVYGKQQIPTNDPTLEPWEETVAASEMERQWGVQLTWMPSEGVVLKQSLLAMDNWNTVFAPADPTLPDALLSDDDPLYHEWVTSLECSYNAVVVAGECIFWDSHGVSQYRAATPTTVYEDVWTQSGFGGYLAVSWEFRPDWKAAILVQSHNQRTTGNGYGGLDQTRSVGVAASWSITSHWLIKAEMQRIKGTYFLRAADQPTPGQFESEYWTLFALKTAFDF